MTMFDVRDGMLLGAAQRMNNTVDAYEARLYELHHQIDWLVQTLNAERQRNNELLAQVKKLDSSVGLQVLTKMFNEQHSEHKEERARLEGHISELRTQLRVTQLSRLVESALKSANAEVSFLLMRAVSGKPATREDVLGTHDAAYAASLRACKFSAAHFEELRAAGYDYQPPKTADWEVDPADSPSEEQASVPTP